MSFSGRGRGKRPQSRPYQKKYMYNNSYWYYNKYKNIRKTPYTFVGEVQYLIDTVKYTVDSTSFNKRVYEVFDKLKNAGHKVEGFSYVFTSLSRQQLINLYRFMRINWYHF